MPSTTLLVAFCPAPSITANSQTDAPKDEPAVWRRGGLLAQQVKPGGGVEHDADEEDVAVARLRRPAGAPIGQRERAAPRARPRARARTSAGRRCLRARVSSRHARISTGALISAAGMMLQDAGQLAAAIGQLAETRNEPIDGADRMARCPCGAKLSASRSSSSAIAACSAIPANSRAPVRRPTAICTAASADRGRQDQCARRHREIGRSPRAAFRAASVASRPRVAEEVQARAR